jgi:hypothetical protein
MTDAEVAQCLGLSEPLVTYTIARFRIALTASGSTLGRSTNACARRRAHAEAV